MELTPRQQEILDYIEERLRTARMAPTVREIGRRFGISSTGTVRNHVEILIKKGVLRKIPGVHRGLRLVSYLGDGEASKSGKGQDKKKPVVWERSNTRRIPILGRAAAGLPLLAEENLEGYLDVDEHCLPHGGDLFALRVEGESMVDADIRDRDLVFVRQQTVAESGEVVVASIDEGLVIKRLRRYGKGWRLESANAKYPPIKLGAEGRDDRVVGKVVGHIRHR
jgi:repressor LexA